MTVLAFAYPNCEDLELVATVDTLRRCGATVTIYATQSQITCAHGIKLLADTTTTPNPLNFDAIFIPGGSGYKLFSEDASAKALVQSFKAQNKLIFAICAAPGVLTKWKIFENLTISGYPGCEEPGCTFVEERVVVGDNFVTGRGPGVAIEFAVECAKKLGKDGEAVKKQMLVK